jgi:16S rRNA (guanine527-N7)-methyltransferase
VLERERQMVRFIGTPPGFGARTGSSGWVNLLLQLESSPGTRKSLVMKPEFARVRALLATDRNVWRERLAQWQVTGVVPYVAGARTLVDVGTGAGLPGIPLAISRPDLLVTLLESSHMKATYLEQARMDLKLENIAVACERVERWHPQAKFDAVVSRAFAELADFVQGARHLVAPEGRMLAMKGVHPFDEIARLPATCRLDRVVELTVPTLEAKRHLVLLEAA